ncbi:hypothetical protein DFH11DRAFT_1067823 [Phellopilus nigrolimitatus]|nr:hypothetical protein DFH11DRAFT_1067823 [Phellopilus nigrolimitatus]
MDKIPIIEREDDLKTSDDSEFILKKSAVTTEDSSEVDSYFYSDNFETSFKAIPIKPRVRDLPFIRPRIGRGGRLHIDRWYPTRRTLSGEDLLQLKSSHTKGDENVTASEVRETLDRVAERWRYDSPEEALSDTRHPLYDDFEPEYIVPFFPRTSFTHLIYKR